MKSCAFLTGQHRLVAGLDSLPTEAAALNCLQIARACLSASDSATTARTWQAAGKRFALCRFKQRQVW
jgi:hypothetical protein